jgi:hypothetical protein
LAGQVNFVGVNGLDDGQGLPMAREFGIDSWPLARDLGPGGTGALHDRLGGQGMPITAFSSATGQLVDFADGAPPEATLRPASTSSPGAWDVAPLRFHEVQKGPPCLGCTQKPETRAVRPARKISRVCPQRATVTGLVRHG